MTTPEPDLPAIPAPDFLGIGEDGLAQCQREGTCCLKCYAEVGECCTCEGTPPLWVLDTSDGGR